MTLSPNFKALGYFFHPLAFAFIPGSARALACSLRRLAAMLWKEEFATARALSLAREARALPRLTHCA